MSYTGREQQKLWLVSFPSSVKKERSYDWFNVQWINIHYIHLNFKISKQHHKEYNKFIKELDIFLCRMYMYTYSVYYPLCLQFLNSEKNSQFEIMKFDNSNISLKYFHLMYIF